MHSHTEALAMNLFPLFGSFSLKLATKWQGNSIITMSSVQILRYDNKKNEKIMHGTQKHGKMLILYKQAHKLS
jgi:hypothetical protein